MTDPLPPHLTSPLPLLDICPHCLAVLPAGDAEPKPLAEGEVTILMTMRDDTGRRAVVRSEFPRAMWDGQEPEVTRLMVRELKMAHAALKRQAAAAEARAQRST